MTRRRVGGLAMLVVAAATAGAACEEDEPAAPAVASASSVTSGGSAGGPAGPGGSGARGGGGGMGGTGAQGGAPGDWSCLGTLTAPMFTSGPPVQLEVATTDWIGLAVIPDVEVRVCDFPDASCQSPTSQGISDSMGIALVEEAVDHRQYHDYSLSGTVAPTLRFFNGPYPASGCSAANLPACECEGCTLPQCDDGMGNFADCPCPQCATDPYCSNPNNCSDDGECDPFLEGCVCADCAAHPLCGGGAGGGGAGGAPSFVCVDVTAPPTGFDSASLLTPAELTEYSQEAGTIEDPTRGHLFVSIFDCEFEGGEGVRLSIDSADGQTTYGYIGGSANVEPALTETSLLGQVIVFNLPPGTATITGEIVATGELLPTRTVQVRAGTLSIASMDATPEAM